MKLPGRVLTKLSPILLLSAAVLGCHSERNSTVPAARDTLARSADMLQALVRSGENPVPDALLNRTKCVLLVPGNGLGVVSCRYSDNGWSEPAFVTFTRERQSRASGAPQLLAFLTSDRAVQDLQSGNLRLGTRPFSAPGLLVRRSPTVTDADLAADAFQYERMKNGLAGNLIAGAVRPENLTTRAFYLGKLEFRSALNDRKPPTETIAEYSTAIASFFNAITPAGIIIHHSATLPGEDKVPGEQDIDAFHRERGFEVVCFGKTYHVAYQYLVNPDGKIVPGRPDHCEGAHARGYNAYLGISVLGDFSSVDNPKGAKGFTRPTAAQMKSLTALCRRLMGEYHIPVQRILRHSDVARTRCPGDRFPFAALLHGLEHSP